jgi:hypothetical protein
MCTIGGRVLVLVIDGPFGCIVSGYAKSWVFFI